MASEKYKLMFGGNPDNEVSLGFLEKGNSTIKGKEQKTKFRKGNCVFPNRTEGWGRRYVRNAKGEDVLANERIDASHKDYYGKIKWLKWGDKDGYPIEARYKPNSSSIDYQYQILKLGMKRMEDDLENNYLQYPSGYNEFDIESNGPLIEFFKIYFLNEDSASKDPKSENSLFMFREVKEFNTKEFEAKEIDNAFEAGKIVREANSFEKLQVLKTVLSPIANVEYDVSKENSLYDALIVFAGKNGKELLQAVDVYKLEVSKLIELGKAYQAFDTTLNGVIYVVLPAREILIDEVEGKQDEMLDWLYDNCLEPRVFQALEKLKLYSNKFKS